MSIQIRNLNKHFGNFQALRNIDLTIESGELLALLGPSGCGKTTLLRVIAGLESADSGQIAFSGEDATHLHVRDRNVGFVFQHYALFRHMSVFENVAFGLRVKPRATRPCDKEIEHKVHELLKMVQLDWLADRYPSQLSGGQRQRIALARALAVEPKVLLLDEPFGALDAKVRKELRRWLRRLHDDLHVTSIFVTHDQDEALEVSDRVVLMNRGVIEQSGSPQDVWTHPASPFVYGFLGDVNRFEGVADRGMMHFEGIKIEATGLEHARDQPAQAYVRPHDLELSRLSDGHQGIAATLDRVLMIGPLARLELTPITRPGTSGQDDRMATFIEATVSSDQFSSLHLREGDKVSVRPRHARVFLNT
ncbi:sulfate/molybdate ABC transporter ATP-binding protein [Orrella marina]|uniref:Sulfate ABC transporter ATP-binding protein n=1 Tax=Orrella marina TaxID=2163011 RepID=A0A2R4XG07_9BURK|nr:sulfate ABC transporter ATP-binding protein [Orrella marina]AWB32752.1 sulfate ABC transporter ATP-binding protein [Orrella marina]